MGCVERIAIRIDPYVSGLIVAFVIDGRARVVIRRGLFRFLVAAFCRFFFFFQSGGVARIR